MLWKCCTQYANKFGKLSSGHRTGKGQFSFQYQRRAMSKNVQTTAPLHSFHMLARSCWKSFKFSALQSLSRVWLCNPMTAARQASLSITNSWSSLKLMSTESVMPSHPLSFPSSPTFNLSQHQDLFKWVSSLHQVAKVLEYQLQHQSFQWTPRTDLL